MHRPARMIERGARCWLLAWVLCLVAAWPAAWAQGSAAEVTQLRVDRAEDGVLLSSTVRFDLPPVVEDALTKGIPMYFLVEATIYRDRWYWYDKRVASATRHMRLIYQPLTRRWRLQVSSSPIVNSGLVLGQVFDSQQEALEAVQRISGWRIADPGEVDPEVAHTVDFRFQLDVSQLPRPFQIGAVGESDWNILAVRKVRLQPDHPK
jgi:hypothetical protein